MAAKCEDHHLATTGLRETAFGTLQIPLCVTCHDAVDRLSIWDNFDSFVRGYEPLWAALPVESRLLLLKFYKVVGQTLLGKVYGAV